LSDPPERLFEEVAYIAYHFHWPLAEILSLENADRRRFLDEIAALNRRAEGGHEPGPGKSIPLQFWPSG
jgi:hypothetical protein